MERFRILPGKVTKVDIKNENIPIVGWFKIQSEKKIFLKNIMESIYI